MGILDHLTCFLRNLYAGLEATVRTGHETTDWFQIGKGACQGCILSSAYLTYMQSTSWKMPGWMKHNLESRLPGEISITSADDITLMAKSKKELKSHLMKEKEDSEKVSLKFNIQKTKTQVFTPGGQSIGDSASTSVLPKNIQTDFLWDGLVGFPCCPRDSQESSPTPQFKSINSLALSFLYSPTLTSIHEYWKKHIFD